MKHILRIFLTIFAVALTAISCQKPENEGEEISYQEQKRRRELKEAQQYLKTTVMDTYYYWYDKMPNKGYSADIEINKYFNSLLYFKDRWSWMMDGKDYIELESGVVSGTLGASFGQPWMDLSRHFADDYNVVVRFVYPDSPLDKAGVTRGYILDELDDHSVQDYYLSYPGTHVDEFNDILNDPGTTTAHKFRFKTPDGEYITVNVTAVETLNTRPGLVKKIFTAADYPGLTQPVGYFHYLSFMADDDAMGKSMLEDITEAMDYFKQNNVKNLILDLRYNGGGDSRASNLLVSYLAPASARGQVYVSRTHNDKCSSEDESYVIQSPADAISSLEKDKSTGVTFTCKPDSPEFDQLFFITGRGSASASEMTLNGLKPLANIKHVGDTTYGKPNGMYVFYYPYDNTAKAQYYKGDFSKLKYVYLPICFYNANGQGQYIPDDGMIPEFVIPDDLYHDFNADEMNIEACLHYVVKGYFPKPDIHISQTKAARKFNGEKRMMFKSEEDSDENWGRYVVKPDFL